MITVHSFSILVSSLPCSYNDEFQARLVDNHSSDVVPLAETPDAATVEGSRVGVFYSKVGADMAFLYFVVNGECRGPFPFELQDGPLFAVCDVYGRTKTVKVISAYEGNEQQTKKRNEKTQKPKNIEKERKKQSDRQTAKQIDTAAEIGIQTRKHGDDQTDRQGDGQTNR